MFTRGLCVRVVAVSVADATSPMKIMLSASVVLLVNNRVLAKAVVSQSVIESWLRTLPLTLLTTIVAVFVAGTIGFNVLYAISSENNRFLSIRVFSREALLSLPSTTSVESPFSAFVSVSSTIPSNTSSWRLYPSL